jgi:hypothetical protein
MQVAVVERLMLEHQVLLLEVLLDQVEVAQVVHLLEVIQE